MTLAPTGTDQTPVYTSRALVEALCPTGATHTGTTEIPGKVSTTKLTNLILRASRRFDAKAATKGLCVPFPTITATNPATPDIAVEIVTNQVVGEVRAILAFGNRTSKPAKHYLDLADGQMEELMTTPSLIGVGRVTSPDDFLTKEVGTSSAQYGQMNGQVYRLRNRNLIVNSLRWVTSAGVEVFRTEHFPFTLGQDYDVLSYAEGLLSILDVASITAAVGAGGGAVYDFSWRSLTWGQCHPAQVPGVGVP